MTTTGFYVWIEAPHVAPALLFSAGIMLGTLFPSSTRQRAGGRTLTAFGHWLGPSWLGAKFTFVAALPGLHGVQAGLLRRKARGLDAAMPRTAMPLLLICVCSIKILAGVKPF